MSKLPVAPFVPAERGFLPEKDPPLRLPKGFEALDQMGAELPKLLLAGSPRKYLSQLPPMTFDLLTDRPDLERAMKILSFIGHGYVWGEQPACASIPKSLAIPWCHLAKRLARTPTLVYCSYALNNWRRLDREASPSLGNIALLQNFLAGIDEEWFVLIHVDIELRAAPAIGVLEPLQQAAQNGDASAVREKLGVMARCLDEMNTSMDRMPEHCDPYIYYRRVRPYIHGWKNNPALPGGLIYEGVDEFKGEPQQFRGETGSQSSIIPCFDAALGIVHKQDALSEYLNEMRDYMPAEHRAFLDKLEKAPPTRKLILERFASDGEIKDLFNACIRGIDRFRTRHLEYASSYIDQQKQDDPANPTKIGTGGTPFMIYLAKHRQSTEDHLI